MDWLSSTGHKVIGHLYLITSFGFFMIAGLMAMIMRAQLMGPDNHLVSDQQYNELFTMHGAIMLLLFAAPLFVAEVPDRRADADDGRVGDQAAMAAPP